VKSLAGNGLSRNASPSFSFPPSSFHFPLPPMKNFFLLFCVLFPSLIYAEDYAHTWIQTHVTPRKMISRNVFTFETPESLPCEAGHNCSLSVKDGALVIDCTGTDPYFSMPEAWTDCPTGTFTARFTMRCKNPAPSIYWTDANHPGMVQDLCAGPIRKATPPDAEGWQTVDVELDLKLPMIHWRVDPAGGAGLVEIRKIEFFTVEKDGPQVEVLPMDSVLNPPETGAFPKEARTLRLSVTNPKNEAVVFIVNGHEEAFKPEETRIFTYTTDPKKALDRCVWKVSAPNFPEICRELEVIHDVEIPADWTVIPGKAFDFCVAPDESVAFLVRDGRKIAALTHLDSGKMPIRVRNSSVFPGLDFEVFGSYDLPVIHVPGRMTLASVPGVELLEKGEWSSSRADFWTNDHLRIRPELHYMTQHWLGILTEDGAFRLRWSDPKFQPVFAVPNYFDSTPDARFTLEIPQKAEGENSVPNGTVQKQTVHFEFSPSTDETEFLKAGVWPEIKAEMAAKDSDSPRKAGRDLFALYREQMENGPLHTPEGWGHCAGWGAAPFCDQASALWRIGGTVPDFQFGFGGAHVENGTIFFVRNQADRWLSMIYGSANGALQSRGADGFWRYAGKYDVTHWESTALGINVRPIWTLMQAWAVTGDAKYLNPALESLALCRRFHVARGAQCWEMPLHTPDPLAAAYAVRACVMAYRATGDSAWLKDAERWALDGATYVFLWDDPSTLEPFQYGAYIGVLGATNWKAPNWIGRPVQWIGTVYAYALLDLAEVLPEDSEEAKVWHWVAEQITNAAERQIYTEGPSAGLLPDSVNCVEGARYAADINPAVPIALRLRLSGKPASVYTQWNDRHHVAAPFPFTLNGDSVEFTTKPDVPFQYLMDGEVKETR